MQYNVTMQLVSGWKCREIQGKEWGGRLRLMVMSFCFIFVLVLVQEEDAYPRRWSCRKK